ncbi:sce7726 family protein [Marivirga harenae]|uniref:sce7726 family protein n=1 Tax=Marivirga harenae TaxID=2010992 RepID=UPI0026DF7D2B|nr:sce7726 family protein [Marivirga harenae]WKV14028.1 sce7726 family protein [Marivirga harenae]
MSSTRTFNPNQLRDYSYLFSRSAVKEWMNGNLSSIDFKIKRYDENWYSKTKKTYIDYLKFVYSVLEKQYQNEYILKNSFLNDWLIKEMGESNSELYSEFRIGSAIADLVMFNGTSRAFEIKTELDSDKRLDSQLNQYRKVFNEIFLIVPVSKIKEYETYDSSIGIICFDILSPKRFQIVRSATRTKDIDAEALMHIFHTSEYKEIVTHYYGQLPEVTSFNQFEVCKGLIAKIPQNELNQLFINKMKSRAGNYELSARNYREFNQLSLALRMNMKNRKQLFSILKAPLNV